MLQAIHIWNEEKIKQLIVQAWPYVFDIDKINTISNRNENEMSTFWKTMIMIILIVKNTKIGEMRQ